MRLLSAAATALFLLMPSGATGPVLVEKLSLDYNDGAGTATAVKAQFEIEGKNWDFANATFDVRSENGNLVIAHSQDNFSYAIEASFLKDVRAAKARDVSVDYAPGRVIAKIASARLEKEGDITILGKTALTCRAAARTIDPVDACIFSGTFTLASLTTEDTREMQVSEADVSIIKGKTTFAVKVGGIGKLNGNGTTTHDAANGTIKIKVDKVKLGILDITGQFFSQLENSESDTLRVERPYIYVVYKAKK